MKSISCRDAYIRYDELNGRYIIGNSRFESVFIYNDVLGFKHIALNDKINGSSFVSSEKSNVFSLTVNMKKYDGRDFRLKSWKCREGNGEELFLIFELSCSKIPLLVELTLRIVPDSAGYQQTLSLKTNEKGLNVHSISSFDYTFDIDAMQEIAYYMRGCKHQGCVPVDKAEIPYEDFRMDAAELGRVFLKSGRRATEDYLPVMFINSAKNKAGLFMGIQWSGHWFMDARNILDCSFTQKIINISAGPDEFSHMLVPGKAFSSPSSYIGVYTGENEDAAEVHRRFLEKAVIPKKPWEELPVTYNAWYSMEDRISEAALYKETDLAAELGAEFFIIDAGWYGGSSPEFSSNGDFSKGQGDWKVDPKKFPSGMKAFSDYVHSKGMKFGLWVEPERVDPRTFEAGGWKKEWLSCEEDGEPYEFNPVIEKSSWLCFGEYEVREWVKAWLSKLIEENNIDWIKWDSNWWVICKGNKHGHTEGDGEYSHVQGIYEVFEYLIEKYPHLTLENCAGGGTRMDTGILQYSHVQWVDDETELSQRVRCHCSRLSSYMPLQNIYTFSLPEQKSLLDYAEYKEGKVDKLKNRLDFEVRSRMMGVWGLGYNLSELSETVLEIMKTNISTYKKFRDIIKDGRFYNLKPIDRLMRPELKAEGNEAYMAVMPDYSRAVVFVFKNLYGAMEKLKLEGLDSYKTYSVRNSEGRLLGKFKGEELQRSGFVPELDEHMLSEIYLFDSF